MNTISSISIVLAIVTVASGYPTGPPARSCASMAPSTSPYGHGAQAQTSPPPYVVTMDVPCNGYAAEKTYKMTLRATGNYEIKGFMCQVRKADGTDATAIGKFTAFEPASKGKYLACTSSKGAVSHKNRNGVNMFEATWTAPASIPSYNLRAFCTALHKKDTYWLKVPSDYFTSEDSNTNNCEHGQCVANATASACVCDTGYVGVTCNRVARLTQRPGRCDQTEWSVKFNEWKALFDSYQAKYGAELKRTDDD
ncbi:putative defense protein 3 [Corticium candelabrum]|uniref:putative defense protein 3 n=1 Tax=Corticium candelabrum TaxID=121492 RepID=UPI002E256519|nr:putative defense protein 3 [Corticium candelabrum]